VQFMTDDKFKILSFRSRDPVFEAMTAAAH
jgi:hypothetical protein